MTKRASAAAAVIPPTPKRIQTTLVLDDALWRRAKMRAVDERCSLRDILTRALLAYLLLPIPGSAD